MKRMFSGKLYLQGLRKVRTAGIAMAIVITVLNAWIPIQCMTSGRVTDTGHVTDVEAGMFAPFGFLFMLFAPLLVYNMFSYLNERKSSDFFHALPQKRICIYISFMSAVLTWIVSVLCVTSLVNTVLWSMADGYALSYGGALLTLVGFLILALVTAGFMALSMTLTGTAVANCLVFLLFFLFVRACGMFFLYGFSEVAPMFHVDSSLLKIFDIQFFLPVGLLAQIFDGDTALFHNPWFFIYWTAVAVALLSLSAWAYCRRRSESATKSAPNRLMQNIYRIGATFPFLMMGVFLMIAQKDFYLCVLCAFVAFLVWVIFELLTTKKVKNVIRSIPMLLIPAVLAGGYAASVYLARNIFYASTPERDEIKSVKLAYSDTGWDVDSYSSDVLKGWETVVLTQTEITDDEILDHVYEAIGHTKKSRDMSWNLRQQNGYIYSDTVTITLTSGREVTYHLRTSYNLYAEFSKTPQIENHLLQIFDHHVDAVLAQEISSNSAALVWEAFKEDFKGLTAVQKEAYFRMSAMSDTKAFAITVYGTYENQRFYQSYKILSDYMPNAYRLYLEHVSESEKLLSELNAAVDKVEASKDERLSYAYMTIESYTQGKKFSVHCSDFKVIKEFLLSLEIDSHLTDYANAENVYRFVLQLEMPIATPTDETAESAKSKEEEYKGGYEWTGMDAYITFSDEDIERYLQIANYGTMPIS